MAQCYSEQTLLTFFSGFRVRMFSKVMDKEGMTVKFLGFITKFYMPVGTKMAKSRT